MCATVYVCLCVDVCLCVNVCLCVIYSLSDECLCVICASVYDTCVPVCNVCSLCVMYNASV